MDSMSRVSVQDVMESVLLERMFLGERENSIGNRVLFSKADGA
jgi:hypothetical protein